MENPSKISIHPFREMCRYRYRYRNEIEFLNIHLFIIKIFVQLSKIHVSHVAVYKIYERKKFLCKRVKREAKFKNSLMENFDL